MIPALKIPCLPYLGKFLVTGSLLDAVFKPKTLFHKIEIQLLGDVHKLRHAQRGEGGVCTNVTDRDMEGGRGNRLRDVTMRKISLCRKNLLHKMKFFEKIKSVIFFIRRHNLFQKEDGEIITCHNVGIIIRYFTDLFVTVSTEHR